MAGAWVPLADKKRDKKRQARDKMSHFFKGRPDIKIILPAGDEWFFG